MVFYEVLMNPLVSSLDEATPFDDLMLGKNFQGTENCLMSYSLNVATI